MKKLNTSSKIYIKLLNKEERTVFTEGASLEMKMDQLEDAAMVLEINFDYYKAQALVVKGENLACTLEQSQTE
jgi:hypothetical protein